MGITSFYQIRAHEYMPPTQEEARACLDVAKARAEKIDSALISREIFYGLGLVAFLVGGLLTGGAFYALYPLYTKVVLAGATVLTTSFFAYKGYTVDIPVYQSHGYTMHSFFLPKCREGGKLFLRSEEAVKADLIESLRKRDFSITVHQTVGDRIEKREFLGEEAYDVLKQMIYNHFVGSSENAKQARRRTFKVLDRLSQKARQQAIASIRKEQKEQESSILSKTTVRLFLHEDHEKIQTFSLCHFYKDRRPHFTVPVLIEEDYRTKEQLVFYQSPIQRPLEHHVMPRQRAASLDFVLPDHRPSIRDRRPSEEALDAALDAMRVEVQRDLGRMQYTINKHTFLKGSRENPETFLRKIIQELQDLGYTKQQIIIRLSALHQGISGPAVQHFQMAEQALFPALRYPASQHGGGGKEITARFYGPAEKRDFVQFSYPHQLVDREQGERDYASIRTLLRYTFDDESYQAICQVLRRASYPD